MKVFTAEQMRDFDRAAIEDYGIPSIVLMENAALRVVEFLEAKFAPLSEKKIVILCGKGNNGGDGLAIARHLLSSGARLSIIHAGAEAYQDDAKTNFDALQKDGNFFDWSGLQSNEADDEKVMEMALHHADLYNKFLQCDVAVDAFFGTGFKVKEGEEVSATPDNLLHGLSLAPRIVSVDILSGLNSVTGELHRPMMSASVQCADYTVTFAAPKRGFFVRDGIEKCGEIWIGDIGTLPQQREQTETGVQTLDLQTAKQLLPHRSQDAHKGDAGRALIVGGSLGMSGSICLASKAALASGAGLVSAAVPAQVLPIFAASVLEAVSHPLPNDDSGHLTSHAAADVAALWDKMQVVALGPGLGRTPQAFEFARRVVRECPAPLIVDADALHALPAIVDDVKARTAPTILTPHPGEMGVLMDSNAKAVNDARFDSVAKCAQKYGAIVVLKGARTLVCDSSGEIWVNLSGHPGMATGGAGDVLTGTIAGLLAQLQDADAATKLGVYLHGLAGEIAAKSRGNGLVAGDIAANLPAALIEIGTREVEQINGRLRKLE